MSDGEVVKYKQVKIIIMSEKEDDDVQDALSKLEMALRIQIEKSLVKTDIMVSTQRSRPYKFWCWLLFGHLLNDRGVCLRCGKKVGVVTVKPK